MIEQSPKILASEEKSYYHHHTHHWMKIISLELFCCCNFGLVFESDVKESIPNSAHRSRDLDPIPISFLRDCLDILLLPLIIYVMNNSLLSGSTWLQDCFPERTSKGNLPLTKTASRITAHVVSNLSFLSNVLAGECARATARSFQSFSPLNHHQSACRAAHSTKTALLKVLNDLLTASNDDKVSILALLDLSASTL